MHCSYVSQSVSLISHHATAAAVSRRWQVIKPSFDNDNNNPSSVILFVMVTIATHREDLICASFPSKWSGTERLSYTSHKTFTTTLNVEFISTVEWTYLQTHSDFVRFWWNLLNKLTRKMLTSPKCTGCNEDTYIKSHWIIELITWLIPPPKKSDTYFLRWRGGEQHTKYDRDNLR